LHGEEAIMQTIFKPLTALTAGDIMSRDPVVIPRHLSLRAAAHLLSSHGITGAPVVNAQGKCIGVLSATDFMQWAEGRPKPRWSAHERACLDGEIMEAEPVPEDDVDAVMTPDPVMAEQNTSIIDLARMMLNAHIHRVIIVDAGSRPVGIVSSTDILAALAQIEPRV